ncbi:alternate-type signal peptide domain-containing protein [Rhodococcus hoagii]|uniref:alternate-type signal peptide domain-containing protein n=1 Tax=Rhodococcus hoagii TaxID=43767 RepID=UPI001962C017|nr:alternate-type signal peptide domain-containing protein [Prescottella equi]MBM9838726.1 alternate-type signal peptide domain-containing protein [Prescottella equi]
MNKKTKGAIAAGAAAALLAGGAGSFALWTDSEELNGGTITAGSLSLSNPGTPTWKNAAGNPIQLNTYKAAPGDVLTYTNTVVVNVVGDNLKADFSATPGTGTNSLLTVGTVSATIDSAAVTEVDKDDSGKTVTVSFPVTFSVDAENEDMNAQLVLASVGLSLNQVDPTP